MKKTVNLLDCTLRDGGYVNDWNFGHDIITGIYKRLDDAGVDYIEIGFLDDRREFNVNYSIQPNTDCYNKIYSRIKKKHAIPVAMIDYGTCDISNIGDCSSTFIDGIRVIFKKEKIDQALPFCKAIKEKGYKLFIQAISITAYSDLEMLEYINKINKIEPYAFSIVDTYGLLDNRKLTNYFNLFNNNLKPDIKIGYHAHNNFQLAFSNSIKFLALETKRDIIVDSTIYGMGKSAGNCATELISMHMNEKYDKNYDIDQFLEILDTDLMPIYQKHYWGYKYNFYISAMQNCHPNYVKYLLDKKTLSVSSVNEILSKIPENLKLLYNKEYIEKAYHDYQSINIDDSQDVYKLKSILKKERVLLIGPGKSIVNEREKINTFVKENNAIIISVNFCPTNYKTDAIFISNAKRYRKLLDSDLICGVQLITTSNITLYDKKSEFTLNYEGLCLLNKQGSDNALLLAIAMLVKNNIKEVYLAGFDGYTDKDNYYDSKYNFAGDTEYRINSNGITSNGLRELSKYINIGFVTESLYYKK